MPDLFLRKREVQSVFQLLGERENDLTYSVAWGLANSRSFLRQTCRAAVGVLPDPDQVTIRLQHHEGDAGVTDIEIESPGSFFFIVEAKRGWTTPSLHQLSKYAKRRSFLAEDGIRRAIVPLSECTKQYAFNELGCKVIDGTAIVPISWKDLVQFAIRAQQHGTHAEKRLLGELIRYLKGLMTMQNKDSNWVYVVSLNSGIPEGWKISWIDIVEKRLKYFHLMGKKGWPKEPPNYIAFRYRGKLQSIHHIESTEVFTNPRSKFPEAKSESWEPHFLYSLGPAFRPSHEVPMGKLWPNGRNWCMLDTLFTCKTISEAKDVSTQRFDG